MSLPQSHGHNTCRTKEKVELNFTKQEYDIIMTLRFYVITAEQKVILHECKKMLT